ncbi:MAG: DUF3365 domain-containing protein [Rhodocyclaceae bacterium]
MSVRIAACLVSIAAAGAAAAQEAAYADEARKVVGQLQSSLAGVLLAEVKKNGPQGAIGVCKDIAPAKASELSRSTGWRVSRVSLKVRNPLLGMPDEWEAAQLAAFDARVAAGENAATLEKAEIVREGERRYFRYMKALPVQAVCTNCHGEKLDPGVRAALSAGYPHDRATGYREGMVRGAVSIKRPL